MRVRKMDANGDYVFGNQQADFWRDVPEAPAQVCMTRLNLETGSWFLDSEEGIAWHSRVLGTHTAATRDPAIRTRILGTKGVTGIAAYSSYLERETRAFSVNATIDTQYGAAAVSTTVSGAS